MVVSVSVGRSLSFVNAQYQAVAYQADVESSRYVFQLFKNVQIIKEHLHVSFDKTAQQNSCMQLQIVCLVSINCNELRY